MKLLIVTQKIDPKDQLLGFFMGWVKEFAMVCEEVHVFCLEAQTVDLPENVFVHSLGKSEGKTKLVWLYRLFAYSWKLRERYDAVFVHMNPIHVLAAGLWWRFLHKRIGLWYTHPRVDLKLRIATILSHEIFTGSKSSFQIKTKKRHVMGQGVDPSFFTPKEKINIVDPVLVVVGRISPIKNLKIALDLLVLLRSEYNATLHIVGGPSGTREDVVYEQSLRDQAAKLNISEHITWHGPKDAIGVRRILKESDFFVHTSLTHSADKTLPEAMASKLFVVSSNKAYQQDLPKICFRISEAGEYKKAFDEFVALSEKEKDVLRKQLRNCVEKKHSLHRLVKNIVSLY